LIPHTRGMTYYTRAARTPKRQPGQELNGECIRRETCWNPSKQRPLAGDSILFTSSSD
jgi:hypothetical protein